MELEEGHHILVFYYPMELEGIYLSLIILKVILVVLERGHNFLLFCYPILRQCLLIKNS